MMLRYFHADEFKCKCSTNNGDSCGMDISLELKALIDNARDMAGIPFKITSGARCEAYNKSIGASKTSSHTKGLAVDIKASTSHNRYVIMDALKEVGIDRIGINFDRGFIHCDISKDKPSKVLFGY